MKLDPGHACGGYPHGTGRITFHSTGYTYDGEFRAGERHGRVAVRDEHDQLVFDGNFEDDLPHGHGAVTTAVTGADDDPASPPTGQPAPRPAS